MLYQNSRGKRKRRIIWGGAIFALFLIVYFIDGFPPAFLKKTFFPVSSPLIFSKNKIDNFFSGVIPYFKSKSSLWAKNLFLEEKIMDLEIKARFDEIIEERNRELELVFSIKDERNFVSASIILRPGYGLYNELLVDAGAGTGIKEGNAVTALGKILIGYISEVGPSLSRVKLVSFPDKETNVFIGDKTAAIATGAGSENLEINLPLGGEISEGEIIMTLEKNPLLLGYVEKIIKEESGSAQKIFFRLPLNIQQLHYVYIIK